MWENGHKNARESYSDENGGYNAPEFKNIIIYFNSVTMARKNNDTF